jgi:CheY-like chemotaxis protein
MAQKIKCILLEDEPIQLRLLKLLCEEHLDKYCTVVATYTSSDKFIDEERNHDYDLLLLDIDMPGPKGTDIARLVNKPVIFVTGRDGYEREVLDLQFNQDNIVTLIRKSVDKDKLEKAFKKYLQGKPTRTSAVFNTHLGDRTLRFDDILLITTKIDGFRTGVLTKQHIGEKFHPRNKIMVTTNELLRVNSTDFEQLLEILPLEDFFQINKSSIIGRNAVVNHNTDGLTYVNPLNQVISSSYFGVSPDVVNDFKRWYRR